MKFFTSLLLVLFSVSGFASGDYFGSGARQNALGNAAVTQHDVFAIQYNQAGLAFLNQYSLGVYSSLPYATLGIVNSQLAFAAPLQRIGTFGLSINYYGDKNYNEMHAGLAYARKLGNKVGLGIRFDYLRLNAYQIKAANSFSFDIGLQYHILPKLKAGAHVYNPSRLKINEQYDERLSTLFQIGLSYEPIEQLNINAEFEKEIINKPNFKAGIEYKPIKLLAIRVGVNTQPIAATFGVGIHVKGFQLDLAARYHTQLGITPQAAIIYSFGKPTE